MPAKKRAVKTRLDKEREKEAVRILYCRGESLADAAKAVDVSYDVVRQWASKEGWRQQVNEAQQLVKRPSQDFTIPQKVAFDFAETKKETRSAFARSSLKVAKWAEETAQSTPEILFEMGSQYKAHVESAAKVAGDWEDSSANKFAVSLNINALPQGQVIDVD